jgi:1,4-dihydroxy-2-naphthoate octaprenyltransferase
MLLAFASIVLAVLLQQLPLGALLGLLPALLGVPTVRAVQAHAQQLDLLLPAMGRNVLICLSTPLLMAIGIRLS